jgi:hypothetical protein
MKHGFSINDCMEAAEAKVGIEGWKAYQWEDCDDDSIVTGSVPDGVYSKGPRKGKPRFVGKGKRVIITRVELEARAIAYEAETGKCWDCKGTGQTWAGWSRTEGTKYRECQRCAGTGEAQQ